MKDSKEAYSGFVGEVTEGANEGEEEGGDWILREREEKLLGEGEGGGANGGTRHRDGAFESVSGKV